MPLFLDQHPTEGARPEDLAKAHLADLGVQDRFSVKFLTYWLDYDQEVANCLVEAPDRESVNRAHDAAHGMLASRIIEVDGADIDAFLGRTTDPIALPITEPATRTIVFTDIVGSTATLEALGDEAAIAMLKTHDEIVREVLARHRGREVKHTGDGFMLVFDASSEAVRFAQSLQWALQDHAAQHPERAITIRIGINTGEPIAEGDDLFGMAVNVAARLCDRATAGEVLVSAAVAGVTMGKNFRFVEAGPLELAGLAQPVSAFRLALDTT